MVREQQAGAVGEERGPGPRPSATQVSLTLCTQRRSLSLCASANDVSAPAAFILSLKLLSFLEMLEMDILNDHLCIFLTKYEYLLSDSLIALWRDLSMLPGEEDERRGRGRDCEMMN